MYEYEFRLVVQNSSPFDDFFQKFGLSPKKEVVYYVKPHFRFKNKKFETKSVQSVNSVYFDGVWFRWVCSIETPFESWKRSVCKRFLHELGNFQDPLTTEIRYLVKLDGQAQIYTFRSGFDYNLVFEWEYGTFKKPLTDFDACKLFDSLGKYKRFYQAINSFSTPSYHLREKIVRKPVTCVSEIPEGNQYLYAHKLDGIFGLVYSYRDSIKEKWEGYECVVRRNATLGDGLVFAAEKLESGKVVLLDVYQVRGYDTAGWNRRLILTDFLPSVKSVEGYFVQKYFSTKEELTSSTPPLFEVDGTIIHDVEKDVVLKCKPDNSIDLVYFRSYFELPNGRIKTIDESLEDGCVYEISTTDGKVIRKRIDRFKGNSAEQIENALALGWHGPPIEYNVKK